jgi:hypothetical protein
VLHPDDAQDRLHRTCRKQRLAGYLLVGILSRALHATLTDNVQPVLRDECIEDTGG